MKALSLNKSRHILQSSYQWYMRKGDQLPLDAKADLEQRLLNLESAIKEGHKEAASTQAQALESTYKERFKKNFIFQIGEVLFAIAVALLLAIAVRQMWFELYEIPTGSMRPTYREQDRLAVSKTPFGINLPLTTGHLFFDPDLVEHGSVVTFTTEGIENLDEDTTFLGFIPYKKRLIKRMIGKPGDSLYFYGGKIYGVNKEGKLIESLLSAPWVENLEYIPFIEFAGKVTPLGKKEILFHQMNQPIGKLSLLPGKRLEGEIYNGKQWVKDDPLAQKVPHNNLQAYSDFFGMRNFAMARLLNKQELSELTDINTASLSDGVLYLELRHHPSLTYPQPLVIKDFPLMALLAPFRTIIPLQQSHLDAIMDNMYTARLIMRDGRSTRYHVEGSAINAESPRFKGVPDGMYEFYHGKLSRISLGGVTSSVDADNPLLSHSPENVQKLFNLGIEMNNAYSPHGTHQYYYPSRYAYFRDGDLYLMGAAVLKKDDPLLKEFSAGELKRQKDSSSDKPYIAFVDYGPPLKEGQVDKNFIRTFGITVPSKQYLVLGDNHAMSGDGRVFGFIPESNLQGSPSFLMWPPGERWGIPAQAMQHIFTLPRLIVWAIVGLVCLIWYMYHRRYLHRPIVLKK